MARRSRFAGVREARARGISAVFQEFSLVPQLTVAENLFLGAEPTRHGILDRGAEISRAQELLERLGFPAARRTSRCSISPAPSSRWWRSPRPSAAISRS